MQALKQFLKRQFPTAWLRASARKAYWREYRRTGERELRELPKWTRRNALSVDVGSNIGAYSYHLSRLSKSVMAFEPNPNYAARLRKLGIRNLRVEEVALSDKEGTAMLRIPLVRGGREDLGMASLEAAAVADEVLSRTFPVPLRRLDAYQLTNVGFIKIDVEGHEERVLAGALETIAREKPTVLIEIEERHNPGGLRRIVNFFAARGYATFFFDENVMRSIAEFDQEKHQVVTDVLIGGHVDRRRLAYINNFVFIPQANARQ